MFGTSEEREGVDPLPRETGYTAFLRRFFDNFFRFIPVNLVYCLLSLPVIPSGLAAAGLARVTRNIYLDRHTFGLWDFWETIKRNWRQALAAGVINTAVWLLLIWDGYYFFMAEGVLFSVGLGVTLVMMLVFWMTGCYLWPLLVTVDLPLRQLYSNSLRLVFAEIKSNALCVLANGAIWAVLGLTLYVSGENFLIALLTELLIAVLCGPAFVSLLTQGFVFPAIQKHIIDPYYQQHPEEKGGNML